MQRQVQKVGKEKCKERGEREILSDTVRQTGRSKYERFVRPAKLHCLLHLHLLLLMATQMLPTFRTDTHTHYKLNTLTHCHSKRNHVARCTMRRMRN